MGCIEPFTDILYPTVLKRRISENVEVAATVSAPVAFLVILLLGNPSSASALGAYRIIAPLVLLEVLVCRLFCGFLSTNLNNSLFKLSNDEAPIMLIVF